VSTNASSYATGATVTVSYSGLPGNAHDWIAIAPSGTGNTSYVAWVYTNGQVSGTATFTAPAAWTYVARAFANDTFILLAQSATFTTR
jgi:ABC-type sulfate transport system substrate-binding protein